MYVNVGFSARIAARIPPFRSEPIVATWRVWSLCNQTAVRSVGSKRGGGVSSKGAYFREGTVLSLILL